MKHVTIYTCEVRAYQRLRAICDARKATPGYTPIIFPERLGTATDVLRLITVDMASNDAVVVYTAYPDAINFVGAAVEAGFCTGTVYLVREDGTVTAHSYDADGALTDWPYGCMYADHLELLHELTSR